jgi:hypothetical protein
LFLRLISLISATVTQGGIGLLNGILELEQKKEGGVTLGVKVFISTIIEINGIFGCVLGLIGIKLKKEKIVHSKKVKHMILS